MMGSDAWMGSVRQSGKRIRTMAAHSHPPRRLPLPGSLLALLLLAAPPPAAAHQQASASCDMSTLFAHLADLHASCCPGDACSESGYPGAEDPCNTECGQIFEPASLP